MTLQLALIATLLCVIIFQLETINRTLKGKRGL